MLVEMKYQALNILKYSWPMLIMAVLIVSTLRIAYLINNKLKFTLHKELFYLFYIIYILCLFQAVTFQDVSWSTFNIIPFKEILRYEIGSKLFIKNILGNVVLFFPLGLFINKFIKIKKLRYAVIISFITSLSIEITQGVIGRVFDVDDILLNIIGGLLGFIFYDILRNINYKLPKFLKSDLFLNILSIILVGGLVWFLIP